jgi:methionyl-tRNA synthetase
MRLDDIINLLKNTEILENPLLKGILEKNIEIIIEKYFDEVDYQTYLKYWYELIQSTNKFIQDTQPWTLLKKSEEEEKKLGRKILETAVWLIHKINLLGSFFFIE